MIGGTSFILTPHTPYPSTTSTLYPIHTPLTPCLTTPSISLPPVISPVPRAAHRHPAGGASHQKPGCELGHFLLRGQTSRSKYHHSHSHSHSHNNNDINNNNNDDNSNNNLNNTHQHHTSLHQHQHHPDSIAYSSSNSTAAATASTVTGRV